MSPGPEDLIDQREKRSILENDRRIRDQGTTYSSFAEAFADEDRGGRYGAVNKTTVVGTQPSSPDYPAAPNWALDPSGTEPPLGIDVNAPPEPVGERFEIERSLEQLQATDDLTGVPAGGADVTPASSPPFSDVVESAAPLTQSKEKSED